MQQNSLSGIHFMLVVGVRGDLRYLRTYYPDPVSIRYYTLSILTSRQVRIQLAYTYHMYGYTPLLASSNLSIRSFRRLLPPAAIWTLQNGAPSALYFRFSSVIRTFWSDASLFRDVGEMLAKYLPQHEGDKTVLVLQSFLNELPQQGSDNIREDILGCNSDQQLRDLAHHLIFHILTPCIFFNHLSNICWGT